MKRWKLGVNEFSPRTDCFLIGTTAAILGGAALTAGTGLIAANKSARASQRATDAATAESQRQFDITRADTANQRQLGNEAIDKLRSMFLGGDMSAVTNDPGYQFGLDQGIRAVDSSAISNGRLFSGATGKALARYGTDYATTKTNDVTQRLLAIAGIGNQGITTSANAGANNAGLVANVNMANASNRGSAYLTGANAINNGVQGGIQNFLLNRYLSGTPNIAGGSTYAWNGPSNMPGLS